MTTPTAPTGNGHAKPIPMYTEVLIVGAGISGVNAAYRVQTEAKLDYVIIEQRADVGGTWSLFQYDGIRSDSDMYTLGFPFAPWKSAHAVAGGKEIYEYVRDTANQFNITENIRFNSRLMSANFDSKTGRWTSEVDVNGERTQITSQFLFCCTGYYDYHNPHKADIPGMDTFEGKQILPQFWDTKYDLTGKEIVVIGSGATAVTLLPALAPKSKHITMLQRSPSYFVALPRADPIAALIKFIFPTAIGHTLNRLIWACKYFFFFKICRAFPRFMRKVLMSLVSLQLPKSTPLKPHFDPSYKPWDERICFVPDGDMFAAIRSGKASIETGHIETVTKDGIKLKSGKFLPADVIIPATGLKIALFGSAEVKVDGTPIKVGEKYVWKGFMLHDVPNFFLSFGYTNISWSLGSDVTARHVCKLIKKMDRDGVDYVYTHPAPGQKLQPKKLTNLTSSYLQRAESYMPKQGGTGPWYQKENWFKDWLEVSMDRLTDPTLVYKKAAVSA